MKVTGRGKPERGRSQPTGKEAVPEQCPVFGTRHEARELLEMEGPHTPFINSLS